MNIYSIITKSFRLAMFLTGLFGAFIFLKFISLPDLFGSIISLILCLTTLYLSQCIYEFRSIEGTFFLDGLFRTIAIGPNDISSINFTNTPFDSRTLIVMTLKKSARYALFYAQSEIMIDISTNKFNLKPATSFFFEYKYTNQEQ